MAATVRRSSSRVRTLIALTVLACASVLIVISGDSARSTGIHNRREFIGRRDGFGSSTTTVTTGSSTSSTSSSSSTSQSSTAITSNTTSSTLSSSTSSTTTRSSTVSQQTSEITSTTSSDRTSSQTSTESTSQFSTSSSSNRPTPSSTSTTSTTQTARSTLSVVPLAAPTISSLSDILNPQPATTLNVLTNALQLPPVATTTLLSPVSNASPSNDSESESATADAAAAKSSGFWQNKGAVVATFVIVSLVLLAIAAVAVISYLKRRSARKQDILHEELFEKFSDSGRNLPGPSITAAPMDPFATHDAGYSNPFLSAAEQNQRVVQPSLPVQHPDYYNQPTTTPGRYISPSEAQAARQTNAPTFFQNPVGRTPVARQSYQQSIDSFYGGIAGQPPTSGYAL